MHEFFCLNVDGGDVLLAAAMASLIADLTKQEVVLFVDTVPHFAKHVKNVSFSGDISGELWQEARRKRKIHRGNIDGKNNLWFGHHRGHYVKEPSDPLGAATEIVKEYIKSIGLRKRVVKTKFLKLIDVCPTPIKRPASLSQMSVCVLPNVDKDIVDNLLSCRDIYGFYNAHLKKRNAVVLGDEHEWASAVMESDIIVTCDPLALLLFLPHLSQKKIVFFGCAGIKGISKEFVEVSNKQELIREIREISL